MLGTGKFSNLKYSEVVIFKIFTQHWSKHGNLNVFISKKLKSLEFKSKFAKLWKFITKKPW
jgi:hypothetical protein